MSSVGRIECMKGWWLYLISCFIFEESSLRCLVRLVGVWFVVMVGMRVVF